MRGRAEDEQSKPFKERKDYWGVVLDAPDAVELARFYANLLGWELNVGDPGWATVHPGEGVAYIGFQTAAGYQPPVWPDTEGRPRQMMHLDLEVVDLEAAVASAIESGARLAEFQPQDNVRVMLDPAGHPFCLYS